MKRSLVLLIASVATSAAHAVDIQSASRLAFGPDGVLFVADWKAANVHAFNLPRARPSGERFNITDLDATLARVLGERPAGIEDLVMRPGSGEAYLAVTVGKDRSPAVVSVLADGSAVKVDLEALKSSSLALEKPADGDFKFWDKIPIRSFTVTDMKWRDGKLYVAGLSNVDFSSALRIAAYPFDGKQSITTVSIYHTSHNQDETRAPIRAMAFVDLDKVPHLVAAYTCTPLVTIPLADLKDGAKVDGKTVAELGYGNTPNGLVAYTTGTGDKAIPSILVSNTFRPADVIGVADLAAANAKPGMRKPVDLGKIEGLTPTVLPWAGVFRVDNQDDATFLAVRRDLESGTAQLVSIDKQFGFRLSDFVSEYNFPNYRYPAEDDYQMKYILPTQNTLKQQEGFPAVPDPRK